MKYSIIVPSYNSEKYLNCVLSSLFDSSFVDFEVIVVDCSDNDSVKEICISYPVIFIKVNERFSPGIGRNIGASHASGDYLIFLDSDVMVRLDTLKLLNDYLIDEIQVVGVSLVLAKQCFLKISSNFEHMFFNHESQPTRARSLRKNLSSAFLVVKRDLHINSGGFRNIKRMQDTEYTERLASHNVKLYFNPEIVVDQIHDSKMWGGIKKNIYKWV